MKELGLYSPETIVWKIHSDPSMAVGGIRALLEQALHPIAMAGVATHSNFRDDAWGRLQRTGDYVSTITFGEVDEAEKLAARVRAIHTKLGLDDPHHLLWVHMAMVDSFLDSAVRSGLDLSEHEQNLYVYQMRTFAELVGIPGDDVPISLQELNQLVDIVSRLHDGKFLLQTTVSVRLFKCKQPLVADANPLHSQHHRVYSWPPLNVRLHEDLSFGKDSLRLVAHFFLE